MHTRIPRERSEGQTKSSPTFPFFLTLFPRRLDSASVFSLSLTKYHLRRDVFFVDRNVIIKPPDPEKFLKSKRRYKEKEEESVIKIQTGDEDSDGIHFLDILLRPFLPKVNRAGEEAFFLYKNFQVKLQLEPGFYLDVLKKVRKLGWFKAHRQQLAYLILFDILHPELPTIQELNRYAKEERVTKDESRQRRLIRSNYYPEFFFIHPKSLVEIDPRKRTDGNVSYFSSISTTQDLDFGKDYVFSAPLAFDMIQNFEASLSNMNGREWKRASAALIRKSFLEDVKDFLEFGDDLISVLKRIRRRIGVLDGERALLADEIERKTEVIEGFRNLLNTALLTRWFCIRSLNERKDMLVRGHRIKMRRSEFGEAVKTLSTYCEDTELVNKYLFFVKDAFDKCGLREFAEWANDERSKLTLR